MYNAKYKQNEIIEIQYNPMELNFLIMKLIKILDDKIKESTELNIKNISYI